MRYLGAAGLAAFLLFVTLPAPAQDAGASRPGAPRVPEMNVTIARALNAAIDALNRQRYDDAGAALAPLDALRLSPFERSRLEQVRFNIAFANGRQPEARLHLAAAIEAGGLSEAEIQQARYQIAQSYLAEQDWQAGATALEHWFDAVANPNAAAHYLLAVAYYQMGDYDRALAPAERAVSLSDSPQEAWLAMLSAIRLQRKEYQEAVRVLQRLVVAEPRKPTYWLQLSAAYGQLQDYRSSLATLQLAYDGGLLTNDADIRRYVKLLMFNDLPYRGALVLEDALQKSVVNAVDPTAYELLGNCWLAARELERAVAPLQRAGELSGSGEPFARLAEIHLQSEQWAAAEAAGRRALDKGGLADRANAELLLGVALLKQGREDEARPRFEAAAESPAHRDQARAYLRYIEVSVGRRSL